MGHGLAKANVGVSLFNFYRNTGTSTEPVFEQASDADNPFNFAWTTAPMQEHPNAENGGGFATFGDLDGDGRADLVAGKPSDTSQSTLAFDKSSFYKNTGIRAVPTLAVQSNVAKNPFDAWDTGSGTPGYTPTGVAFHDVDGDGDFE